MTKRESFIAQTTTVSTQLTESTIWKEQKYLLNAFDKLTRDIGLAVAGTFSTSKGADATNADSGLASPVPWLPLRGAAHNTDCLKS